MDKVVPLVTSSVFNKLPAGLLLNNFTSKHTIEIDEIIPFTHPKQISLFQNIVIFTNELPFQNKNNQTSANIVDNFNRYRNENWTSRIIIATDCSKSHEGVALAIINTAKHKTSTGKIHP